MKLLDGKEYSTQRIASKLGLPLSLKCRKVNKLEQFNIIKNQKKFTKPETDESFFTFSIDEIQMTYKNNKIICKVMNKENHYKIVQLWQGFKYYEDPNSAYN